MYQQLWSLDKDPFSLTPDPDFLFLTGKHQEALSALVLAVRCRKEFLVLIGDAGTGKTTLINKLRQLSPNVRFCVIRNPTVNASEFLELVLLNFGLKDLPQGKAKRLVLLQEFLLTGEADRKTSVLIVDEAHKLSFELLEEVRLLANSEGPAHQLLLQVILAGQPELLDALASENMQQFKQRISLWANVGPLSKPEVPEYIKARWRRAGSDQPFPFTDDSLAAIAVQSRGIPRLINALCSGSLLCAAGAGVEVVDTALVAEATQAINLGVPMRAQILPVVANSKQVSIVPPPAVAPLIDPSDLVVEEETPFTFRTLERYTPADASRKTWWKSRKDRTP
jgi:general secretion pathway protein A